MIRSTLRRRWTTGLAASGLLALAVGANAAATQDSTPTTGATSGDAAAAPSSGWKVNTDDCVDPAAANAKIEGELKIGSIMPLSGGVAALAFAPVKDGLAAYINYANEKKLTGDLKLSLAVEDDQYNKDLTPAAATKLIDGGMQVMAGTIGSPNNASIRQTMNDNCIPQLMALTGSPAWGEIADFPWTTGGLVPYDIEAKIYVAEIAKAFPNGAKAALFHVSNEFGQIYADAFKAAAAENKIEIVDEQTIDQADGNAPVSQVTSIAGKRPDVIMAIPLGGGCASFLGEIVNAKAANAGWNPPVYLTNTCASPLILGLAGPAANGLITSQALKNVLDPKYASEPGVKEYVDYMTAQGMADKVTTGTTGWTTGEVLVHVIQEAQKSPDGLTRASIINAMRSLNYVSPLSFDGVVFRLDGDKDVFQTESLQVQQYDATTQTFAAIGELHTEFETK